MSEDAIREDLRALASQTTDHLHALAKETANNSERWLTHEKECAIRYQELRRDLKDMAKMVKWMVIAMIGFSTIVITKGTVPWDFLLALVK